MHRANRSQCRRTAALAATILITGALSGCGAIPWFGGEKDPAPPAELTDFVQEVGINTLWTQRPTKGSEDRRLALVPAVGGARVYVAGSDGRIAALSADAGRVIWERDTDLSFSAGPDLEGDRLILGTNAAQVVTLSANDGRELWRAQVGSEVLSVPRFSGEGKVIVHSLDDTIQALDASNGAELWQVSYPAPVLTLRGSGAPVITPSGIIVGLAGGKLVKLDPTDGVPLWEITISPPSGRSELARIADIDADPVVVGNLLFVGTYNGDLAAVDLDSGTILWRRQLSSYAGLSADQTDLFVTDSEDQVWGADPVSGAGRWRQERLLHRSLTAPAVLGNLIAVGDGEGYVHLLSQTDGRLMGRTRITKSAITARPIAAAGRLYVYAQDGTIAALTTGGTPKPVGGLLRKGPADNGGKSAAPATDDATADASAQETPN